MLGTLTKEAMAPEILNEVRTLLANLPEHTVDKAEVDVSRGGVTIRATIDFKSGGYLLVSLHKKVSPECAVGSVETSAADAKTNPATAHLSFACHCGALVKDENAPCPECTQAHHEAEAV